MTVYIGSFSLCHFLNNLEDHHNLYSWDKLYWWMKYLSVGRISLAIQKMSMKIKIYRIWERVIVMKWYQENLLKRGTFTNMITAKIRTIKLKIMHMMIIQQIKFHLHFLTKIILETPQKKIIYLPIQAFIIMTKVLILLGKIILFKITGSKIKTTPDNFLVNLYKIN